MAELLIYYKEELNDGTASEHLLDISIESQKFTLLDKTLQALGRGRRVTLDTVTPEPELKQKEQLLNLK